MSLAKRQQVNLDNVIMIGVNCGDCLAGHCPEDDCDKFGVDPDTVHKEEIDKGQFIIEYEGGHKASRSTNSKSRDTAAYQLRRCKLKVTRQADLACRNWGVIGDKPARPRSSSLQRQRCSPARWGDQGRRDPRRGAEPEGLEIREKSRELCSSSHKCEEGL